MTLNEQIYIERKRLGLSQDELAQQLDVSRQSVSKWENGTATPDLDKIIKLSEIFGISIDQLVKGEISPTPQQFSNFPIRKIFGCIFFALTLWSVIHGFIYGFHLDYFTCISLPLAICGFICFYFSRYVPLFCSWTIYAAVETLINSSTSTNWRNILNVSFYSVNTNVYTFLSSLTEFIVFIGLIILTVFIFSKVPVRTKSRCLKNTVTAGIILIVLHTATTIFTIIAFRYSQWYMDFLLQYGGIHFVLVTVINWICTVLFIVTATNILRLLKLRNKQKTDFQE